MCVYMEVSENGATPKSFSLRSFPLRNKPTSELGHPQFTIPVDVDIAKFAAAPILKLRNSSRIP